MKLLERWALKSQKQALPSSESLGKQPRTQPDHSWEHPKKQERRTSNAHRASARRLRNGTGRRPFRGVVSSRFRKIQGPFQDQAGGFLWSGTDSRESQIVNADTLCPRFGLESLSKVMVQWVGTRRPPWRQFTPSYGKFQRASREKRDLFLRPGTNGCLSGRRIICWTRRHRSETTAARTKPL